MTNYKCTKVLFDGYLMEQEIIEIFIANTKGSSLLMNDIANLFEMGRIVHQGAWECVNYSLPNSN